MGRRGYGQRQLGQRPMLECLHRPDPPAGDPCDDFDGEVGDKAQQHHLALVRRQPPQGGEQDRIDEVVRGGRAGDIRYGAALQLRLPGPSAGIVHGPMARHGEHPLAHGDVIAPNPMKVACHLIEHLAEHVLSVGDSLRPEIAEDGRRELSIHRPRVPCHALSALAASTAKPGLAHARARLRRR